MNTTINDLPEHNTLEVAVEGQLSMPLRQQLLTHALFTLRAKGYNRLLFDVSKSVFAPNESQTDALQVINMMRQLGFTENDQIAFIREEKDFRAAFFASTANTDGFNLKYFNNRDDALLWLTEN